MSPEAQRIAIAEYCGWTRYSDPKDNHGHRYNAPPNSSAFLGRHALPSYLTDLNEMDEAMDRMTLDQRRWFCNHLRQICGNDGAICATAAQRAEAFLRAVGKWRD